MHEADAAPLDNNTSKKGNYNNEKVGIVHQGSVVEHNLCIYKFLDHVNMNLTILVTDRPR